MRTVKPQKNPKTFYIFEKENKGTVKTYTTSVWPRSTICVYECVCMCMRMYMYACVYLKQNKMYDLCDKQRMT